MNVSYYLRKKENIPVSKLSKLSKLTENSEMINNYNVIMAGTTETTAIYARICWQGYKMKFYISESINPDFWDTKEQRAKKIKKFPEYPEFNARLDNIESAIKKIALRYANENNNQYPTPQILKGLLSRELRRDKNKVSFMGYFADFIARSKAGTRLTKKGKPVTAGTIKNYGTTKTILEKYIASTGKNIDFENIDMVFYNDFIKYVTKTLKQSTNYIGKHIRVIKSILNDATGAGVNTNLKYKGTSFVAISEEVDAVYLPDHELKEMAGLDLSDNKPLDRVRDLFIVGCLTGLRFSDLKTLRPEHIAGDMITIVQTKTGKPVTIPVHSSIKDIMTKYGGKLPKALSNQKANDAIKKIAEKCKTLKKKVSIQYTKEGALKTEIFPKHELISSHTARRSFCTNEYLNKVPVITIMAISGHKTEKAFMKYIKVTPDEHAVILRDVWNKKETEQKKTIAI